MCVDISIYGKMYNPKGLYADHVLPGKPVLLRVVSQYVIKYCALQKKTFLALMILAENTYQ